MEIEVFSLCDGAYNYNGRLTIVGTFDQLNISSAPQRSRVSIAVKVTVSPHEVTNGSRMVLSFKDAQGNNVAQEVVSQVNNLPQNVNRVHLAIAASVDLNISSPGMHKVKLMLNDNTLIEKEFPVVLVQHNQ